MSRGRGWIAGALLCAVLALTLGADAAQADGKKPSRSALKVRVVGLPGGAPGMVSIRGPHRFNAVIERSRRLRVRPGTYRLTVKPVEISRTYKSVPAGSRAFPAKRTVRVRVKAASGATATARYGTIRSSRVTVLRSSLRKVIGPAGNPTAVVPRPTMAKGLRRGMILTASPTRQLPKGLFHRVTKLGAGKTPIVRLEPASLWDAFPTLDLTGRIPLTPGLPSGGGAQASAELDDVDLSFDKSIGKRLSVSCGAPPTGWSFKPTGSLRTWVDSDLHKRYKVLPYGKLTLSVHGSVGFDSTIPSGAHCGVSVGGPALHGVIPVFGVPVPVFGEASLNINVEADAPIQASARASVSVIAGVKLDGRHSAPIFEAVRKGSGGVTATAGGITIGPEIKAGIGAQGVNAHLRIEPNVSAKATRTSCEIGVGFSAGVGLDILSFHPSFNPVDPSVPVYRCPLPDAVYFDGSPGAGPPPPTLGPYTMTPFGRDPQGIGQVTGVADPAGTLRFPTPLSHELVGEGWLTWSHGYTGDVYVSEGNSATVELPAGTRAFYLYAEPNMFQDFNVEATTSDGISSGPVSVYGDSGARYFGFYTTGARTLSGITVTAEDQLAIGEFGISR